MTYMSWIAVSITACAVGYAVIRSIWHLFDVQMEARELALKEEKCSEI